MHKRSEPEILYFGTPVVLISTCNEDGSFNVTKRKGYRFVKDKFSLAGLTPHPSDTIQAPRIRECPVQMEASLEAVHGIADADEFQKGKILTMEFRIQRIHLEESILMNGSNKRVDPDKWRPLIMSFQKFYGLGDQVFESKLAEIPETLYHSPDLDKSRQIPIQLIEYSDQSVA